MVRAKNSRRAFITRMKRGIGKKNTKSLVKNNISYPKILSSSNFADANRDFCAGRTAPSVPLFTDATAPEKVTEEKVLRRPPAEFSKPTINSDGQTTWASGLKNQLLRSARSVQALRTLNLNQLQPKQRGQEIHPVEVKVGCAVTVSGEEDLFTYGLSDCSAFILWSDFDEKKRIYRKRTMIHINGSNLEDKLKNEQSGRATGNVICDLIDENTSRINKMLMVYGTNNTDFSPQIILPQSFLGRMPLMESIALCGKENVEQHHAGSVVAYADGSYKLNETGIDNLLNRR